jgi:hypothetical protein
LAFDTFKGDDLAFTDEAMALLDTKRQAGLVLGGWFSLRFVGPSRAIRSGDYTIRQNQGRVSGAAVRTAKGCGSAAAAARESAPPSRWRSPLRHYQGRR